MEQLVTELIARLKDKLTLDGCKRVFEDAKELTSDHILEKADPEAVTKDSLIEPIIRKLNLEKLPEKHFKGITGETRKVDYRLKNENQIQFLLEAKPVNADLFDKTPGGAVNQIRGLFRLAEVKEIYQFGIATDGITWVFIDKGSRIAYKYNSVNDFLKIRELLTGEKEVSLEKEEEEISKKFYIWYNALLHGGSYTDHEKKPRKISESDCLVENILFVTSSEEREQIAQTILDRLIFIKFLQSKGIVTTDVLEYLTTLDENRLNDDLKQLFFHVLNTEKSRRSDINPRFKDIPYLNGSLFLKTDIEVKNSDYLVKSKILRAVINFLDSFKFIHVEAASAEALDPEILGFIFERAMTAEDRKGTGAYYTPKMVTQYISANTIHQFIVNETNSLLKEKGLDESHIKKIDDLYSLKESIQKDVLNNVISRIKICDNACGSGAFLLAAANSLLDIYDLINENLDLGLSQIEIRKRILKNSLYGVDCNPNAIEIAKLRLWLWLVTAYEPSNIEPLPNIDYNLRVGNSLIGYIDLGKFKESKLNLIDFAEESEGSLKLLLITRETLVKEYRDAAGEKTKDLKQRIEHIDRKLKDLLDQRLFQEINQIIKMTREEFQQMKPLHWGFEFYELFNGGERGFHCVIGNPPYGNILSETEKKAILSYETSNAGEIAANFIERSLHLLRKNGHLGLIVANSIAINASTAKARTLIRKHMSSSRMALFGTRPAKIFTDAEIRVLVFLGEKTDPENAGSILTTDAIKFTRDQRQTLFRRLSFETTDDLTLGKNRIGDGLGDLSLPKVGNKTIRGILLKLKNQSVLVISDRINKYGYKEKLEFRKTGGYWLNALEKMPYKSTKIEAIKFETPIERDFTILLVNSSLLYLYWSTYGNLRDFPLSLLQKFPFPSIVKIHENKRKIDDLKNRLSKCLLDNFLPETGRVGEFRSAQCKDVIDEVDDLLGKIYGLSTDEIQFVKKYDSHIRKP